MKIFLNTSSLFKLYHRESGTTELELVFSSGKITNVFLSDISKIEFASTIWKKVRTKEITESEAQTTLNLFKLTWENTSLLRVTALLLSRREC